MNRTENIRVEKNERETNQSLIRRFTKRLKNSGIIRAVKKNRFWHRPKSEQMKRKSALRRLEKQAEIEKAHKLGKLESRR